MKIIGLVTSWFILVSLGFQNLWAQSPILGEPAYGGSGCPNGTASISISPDQTGIFVAFDNYRVEAGFTTNRKVDRKSCNLTSPIYVPSGFSVSFSDLNMKAFAQLPRNSRLRFDAEIFYAGARGQKVAKTIAGLWSAEVDFSNGLVGGSSQWTPCGASVNFRINTSLQIVTNQRNEQTFASVTEVLPLKILWRRCR